MNRFQLRSGATEHFVALLALQPVYLEELLRLGQPAHQSPMVAAQAAMFAAPAQPIIELPKVLRILLAG